jgi:hypothetical protein
VGSPTARGRHHSGDTTGETVGVASAIHLGSESSGSEVAAPRLVGGRDSSRELL